MKKEIYNLRLLKFATHLKAMEPTKGEPEIMIHFLKYDEDFTNCKCDVEFNMAFFRELPYVFPEDWVSEGYYSDMFGPVFKHSRKIGIIYCVGKFFNLNCDALRECFDVCGDFNNGLHYNSSAMDVARNIFKLLDKNK